MNDTMFNEMEKHTWTFLLKSLEKYSANNRHGYWTDGEDILCKKEDEAEYLANFLEDIGFDIVQTGYYDPLEDKRDGCEDCHTGFYYVSID